MRRRNRYALIVLSAAAFRGVAFGQNSNWVYSGAGADWTATWQVNSNWNPSTSFPSSSTVIANLLAAPIAAGSGTIVIDNPGVTVNRINFEATGTNSNGYTISGAGRLVIANGGTFNVAAGAVGTLAGLLAPPSGATFYKIGGGVLVLSGSGSFSGVSGISVNGGTLRITSSSALPAGGIITTANDGQLELRNAGVVGNLLLGTGSTAPNPDGVVFSSAGNNSWSGNWQVIKSNNGPGVASGTTFTLLGNVFDGSDPANNGFAKTGAGTFAATSIFIDGTMHLNQGTVVLRSGTATNKMGALDIAGGAVPTVRLDVTDAKLIVKGNSGAVVKSYLHSGANGGGWNGNGITSSIAEADAAAHGGVTSLAVGYLRGDQLSSFNGSTATFGGVAVNASDIAIMLTRAGDTDLDGDVDINADLANFVSGYTAANSLLPNVDWHSGDFNHDGEVNLGTDFKLFATGFYALGGSLPGLSAAVGSTGLSASDQQVMQNILTSVPEPMTCGSLIVLTMAALGRRRRLSPVDHRKTESSRA